jgi:hypothetical protein
MESLLTGTQMVNVMHIKMEIIMIISVHLVQSSQHIRKLRVLQLNGYKVLALTVSHFQLLHVTTMFLKRRKLITM